MTTYDVESIFTNIPLLIFVYDDIWWRVIIIPLNEAINICLWRHMMLSHYSPTSLLMKLLIFVYDDIWCWVNIWSNIPLNEAINICLWRHMMLYSPTSLIWCWWSINEATDIPMMIFTNIIILIFVYDDIWCWVIIHQHMMCLWPTSLLMESLFNNILLNEAINICLWRHMMLSHYSPTSLLMMLLIFVYDDIWCWVNIRQHPI